MWSHDAACKDPAVDPDIFFPGKGENAAAAKAVCARCPVRIQCLNYALRTHDRYGVWGGMTERERRRLMRWAVA